MKQGDKLTFADIKAGMRIRGVLHDSTVIEGVVRIKTLGAFCIGDQLYVSPQWGSWTLVEPAPVTPREAVLMDLAGKLANTDGRVYVDLASQDQEAYMLKAQVALAAIEEARE